ncbi:hypothetical protein G5C51_10950 [Streptomyces sp. A7024]|uniref:Uncharacterized protein n=1 Tax=Streptomyces coryli TaxID=1128680 RepID=A0A6G4TZG3_9ACTN|nr:hypothetical protein [Streptomyces coryli]
MTTQLFVASTQYALATATAAVRAGLFGPRDQHRRILVISNTTTTPELSPSLDQMPGFESMRPDYDAVHSWNDFIRPFHPSGWTPRDQDAQLWERALRQEWNLGDADIEVVCESLQVPPAAALATIFSDRPMHVYADGLMSYGPTRNKIDPMIGSRVRRLLYLDLVPGLTPMLLSEFGAQPEVVPGDAMAEILREIEAAVAPTKATFPEPPVLILGQYLSALEILTAEEEAEMHARMVRGAVALGHRHIAFKPHPSAPASWGHTLEREAKAAGAELTVLAEPVLAEVLYQRLKPALVVGCFSTALMTASRMYGLPVARYGTKALLERITPYQNSNRIPVTLVDAMLPSLEDAAAVKSWTFPSEARTRKELTGLVNTVGFAMQSKIYPELRPVAERWLAGNLSARTWRYFKRRRLTALGLPGAVPQQLAFLPRNPTVRRLARSARRLQRAALG